MRVYVGMCGKPLPVYWFYFREHINSACHFLWSQSYSFLTIHLVSMELICLCLCPLVYSMGSSVGGLERLHHLFLPGCRRPIQGEDIKTSGFFSISVNMYLWTVSGGCVFSMNFCHAINKIRTDVPEKWMIQTFHSYHSDSDIGKTVLFHHGSTLTCQNSNWPVVAV